MTFNLCWHNMKKKKFFITTTLAQTLFFFKGQPRIWKEEYDVYAIAAERDRLIEFAQGEGIGYYYMPLKREISFLSDLLCLFRFVVLFVRERPLVVHGNTPKASMLSMLAAWLTFRPVRIYMCHGLRYQTESGFLRRFLMAMEWLSCHCATKVISVSNGVKEQLIKDGLCPRHNGMVVHYGTAGGVNVEFFSRESTECVNQIDEVIPENAFTFSFIGRMVSDKGINELVSAADRLINEKENICLLLIGPFEKSLSPLKEETLNTIQRNPRIIVCGPQKDIRPYLAKSDAFVLPSYREGVGQVLLEASCMDVPCIASDIIGCNEVVLPGYNGELVPPKDEEALYQKMKEWLNNTVKVKQMSKRSRELIVSRYAQKDVWQAYWQVYKSFLN